MCVWLAHVGTLGVLTVEKDARSPLFPNILLETEAGGFSYK